MEVSRTRGEKKEASGTPINYEKVFVERVTIRLDAPDEPRDQATGQELLHGYLCDLYRLRSQNPQFGPAIDALCGKWNIIYLK